MTVVEYTGGGTWTTPGILKYLKLEVWGAGGGGGCKQGTDYDTGGGGGAGGQYSVWEYTGEIASGIGFIYSAGVGGAGGQPGVVAGYYNVAGAGANGGQSRVYTNPGEVEYVTAEGGMGGAPGGTTGAGGAGGWYYYNGLPTYRTVDGSGLWCHSGSGARADTLGRGGASGGSGGPGGVGIGGILFAHFMGTDPEWQGVNGFISDTGAAAVTDGVAGVDGVASGAGNAGNAGGGGGGGGKTVGGAGGAGKIRITYTLATVPTLTIAEPALFGSSTILTEVTITDGGGSAISERGICWGTSADPTTAGDHAADGSGTTWESTATPLDPDTTYHVRGYAVNGVGTGYSADDSLATIHPTELGGIVSAETVGSPYLHLTSVPADGVAARPMPTFKQDLLTLTVGPAATPATPSPSLDITAMAEGLSWDATTRGGLGGLSFYMRHPIGARSTRQSTNLCPDPLGTDDTWWS